MCNNEDDAMNKGDSNGEFSNTYSLWGNSKYYDIKNLSPQNYFTKASAENDGQCDSSKSEEDQWAGDGSVNDKRDPRNRRIITREHLYGEFVPYCKQGNERLDAEWTDQFWKKAGAYWDAEGPAPKKAIRQMYRKEAREQEKLNKTLAQPVKLSKAESMMQKMGWQGGALGKTGEGIVEPIVPNVIYGTKLGLGTYTQKAAPSKPPPKEKLTRHEKFEMFEINVLLYIFEFIRNNTEVELLFDKSLTKLERKKVHYLVNDILNAEDMAMVNYSSQGVMDVAMQILDHNCYVLETQSEGEHPDRMLCLYKMAPSHVYLIIPDDLRDEEKVEDETEETEETPVEPEEDTNPFLQSITRNLKNFNTEDEETKCGDDCKHDAKFLWKIVDFFAEFAESDDFTVFRYLGPFTKEEWDAFDEFLEKAQKYCGGDTICEKLSAVFKKVDFEIYMDVNGHTVIYKKVGTAE